MIFTIILATLGIGVIIGLTTWLVILKTQEIEEPKQEIRIDNYMTQHTNGYSSGAEVDIIKGDKRSLIIFEPRDINYNKLKKLKKGEIIENQKVVVENSKIKTLPMGDWSNEQTRKILLPPTPEDFPESLKKSSYGQILMRITEEINLENVEKDIIREGSNRKTKLLKELGDGEISIETISRMEKIFEDMLKKGQDIKQKDRSFAPTINPYGQS